MSDFEILRNLIREEAQALVEYEYNKKTIVLQEPGDGRQPAYSLKIRNSPDEIIAFKADAFPPASGCISACERYFQQQQGRVQARRFHTHRQ